MTHSLVLICSLLAFYGVATSERPSVKQSADESNHMVGENSPPLYEVEVQTDGSAFAPVAIHEIKEHDKTQHSGRDSEESLAEMIYTPQWPTILGYEVAPYSTMALEKQLVALAALGEARNEYGDTEKRGIYKVIAKHIRKALEKRAETDEKYRGKWTVWVINSETFFSTVVGEDPNAVCFKYKLGSDSVYTFVSQSMECEHNTTSRNEMIQDDWQPLFGYQVAPYSTMAEEKQLVVLATLEKARNKYGNKEKRSTYEAIAKHIKDVLESKPDDSCEKYRGKWTVWVINSETFFSTVVGDPNAVCFKYKLGSDSVYTFVSQSIECD